LIAAHNTVDCCVVKGALEKGCSAPPTGSVVSVAAAVVTEIELNNNIRHEVADDRNVIVLNEKLVINTNTNSRLEKNSTPTIRIRHWSDRRFLAF
jgi:hypothetical protein